MKFLDKFGTVSKIRSRFPRVITRAVTFPGDKVLELITIETGIKNLLNFKFFLTFNDNKRRGIRDTARDCRSMVRFKE